MKARAGGFTLLELIVALTVLGFIMVGVVQGVRVGLRSWDAQTRQIDSTAELDGVDRMLRELVQGINSLSDNDFDGERDHVGFTGRLPQAMPTLARAADLTLSVTGDHRLVLRWVPHRHAVNLVAPRAVEVEVLRNVRAVEFSYWPGPDQPGAGGWLTSLTGSVPSLIRMHIIFMPKDPRHWPDFIAAPSITTS